MNSSIVNNVMASATKLEVGALVHNAQDGCLEFLGHPQLATSTKPTMPVQKESQ